MQNRQLIISVGREFGSGGHVIAEALAKNYGLPLYDHSLLETIADEKDVSATHLQKYDELPRNKFLSRTVKGFNNSPEHNIANMQFDFLRKMADEGKSFVVVGRCAETVLKGREGLITIFVLGDMDKKIERISRVKNVSPERAVIMIRERDRKRKGYHNCHCDIKWGDSRNYDISINSSRLGIEGTTALLVEYIDRMRA